MTQAAKQKNKPPVEYYALKALRRTDFMNQIQAEIDHAQNVTIEDSTPPHIIELKELLVLRAQLDEAGKGLDAGDKKAKIILRTQKACVTQAIKKHATYCALRNDTSFGAILNSLHEHALNYSFNAKNKSVLTDKTEQQQEAILRILEMREKANDVGMLYCIEDDGKIRFETKEHTDFDQIPDLQNRCTEMNRSIMAIQLEQLKEKYATEASYNNTITEPVFNQQNVQVDNTVEAETSVYETQTAYEPGDVLILDAKGKKAPRLETANDQKKNILDRFAETPVGKVLDAIAAKNYTTKRLGSAVAGIVLTGAAAIAYLTGAFDSNKNDMVGNQKDTVKQPAAKMAMATMANTATLLMTTAPDADTSSQAMITFTPKEKPVAAVSVASKTVVTDVAVKADIAIAAPVKKISPQSRTKILPVIAPVQPVGIALEAAEAPVLSLPLMNTVSDSVASPPVAPVAQAVAKDDTVKIVPNIPVKHIFSQNAVEQTVPEVEKTQKSRPKIGQKLERMIDNFGQGIKAIFKKDYERTPSFKGLR